MDRDDPAYKGQSGYNRALLRVYDRLIIGRIGPFVWRCPGPPLLGNYERNIRDGHLDVGPGTGWFLLRSGLPEGARVTIMDPNTTVLDFAAAKLGRFDLEVVEADVPSHCRWPARSSRPPSTSSSIAFRVHRDGRRP